MQIGVRHLSHSPPPTPEKRISIVAVASDTMPCEKEKKKEAKAQQTPSRLNTTQNIQLYGYLSGVAANRSSSTTLDARSTNDKLIHTILVNANWINCKRMRHLNMTVYALFTRNTSVERLASIHQSVESNAGRRIAWYKVNVCALLSWYLWIESNGMQLFMRFVARSSSFQRRWSPLITLNAI